VTRLVSITLTRVYVICLQLIAVRLYTQLVSAEELGSYYFLLTVSYFATAIIFVPVDLYQQANALEIRKKCNGFRPLLNFNKRLLLAYALIALVTLGVLLRFGNTIAIRAMLSISFPIFLYINQGLRNLLNILGHSHSVSLSFLIESIFKIIFFLLLMHIGAPNALTMIASWMAALLVSAAVLVRTSIRSRLFMGSADSDAISVKALFSFAYPVSFAAICNWIQTQGYRLVLVPMGHSAEVGIVSTLFGVGSSVIGALGLIYSQHLSPKIFTSRGMFTNDYLKGFAIVTGLAVALSITIGKPVMRVFFPEPFAQFWYVSTYGILADGMTVLIGGIGFHLAVKNQTGTLLIPAIAGVISAIVTVSIVVIATVDPHGISISLIISQLVVTALLLLKKRGVDGSSNEHN